MRRTRALLTATTLAIPALLAVSAGAAAEPPQTGFEQRDGASWTTHEEELAFLNQVDKLSKRVELSVIGRTKEGRPLHLVRLGDPAPKAAAAARSRPTTMYVCSQHGNEPAGREACLQDIRDLAFAKDDATVRLLREQVILYVPTANPDGRAADQRGNADGTDINRDHLNLVTPEAQAIGRVVRDWKPDLSVDLHEYGPSIPALYDDDVLYLWPRNLNVDKQVHDLGQSFAQKDVVGCSSEAGYSSDEYGLLALGDTDIHQTAGDGDEGIMRNTMGLRHSVGILVETAVSASLTRPGEQVSEADTMLRRVASHRTVTDCSRDYMLANGARVAAATDGAAKRKAAEGERRSAPVYFGGADNEEPAAEDVVNPPPCGYRLSAAQSKAMAGAFAIHGIRAKKGVVPMGQAAEPLIPLLLDERGTRHSTAATPFC